MTGEDARRVTLREFRSGMTDLLGEVAYRDEHLVLTRHGKPVAVVVSWADYHRLMKLLGVFEDRLDAADAEMPPHEKLVSLDDAIEEIG